MKNSVNDDELKDLEALRLTPKNPDEDYLEESFLKEDELESARRQANIEVETRTSMRKSN